MQSQFVIRLTILYVPILKSSLIPKESLEPEFAFWANRGLLQVVLVGIVVEVETQGEVLPSELRRQRRKGIGTADASPGGTIKAVVARSGYEFHIRNFAVFENCELNCQLTFF